MPSRDILIDEVSSWLSASNSTDDAFATAKSICRLHTHESDSPALRDLLIRALSQRERFGSAYPVLNDLAREVGLFPYVENEMLTVRDRAALRFHSFDNFGEAFHLHRSQFLVLNRLLRGDDVVLSAPTSFGKSLLIDAFISVRKPKTAVILVPTIALIDETRRRLQNRFAGLYKIVTHGQQSREERTIYVLTQERAVERSDLDKIDFLVVDEFYKLSAESQEDQRSQVLNRVVRRLLPQSTQVYMLGPLIGSLHSDVPERLQRAFIKLEDAMVATSVHPIANVQEPIEVISDLVREVPGPTIIFSASPQKAAAIAQKLVESRPRILKGAARSIASWARNNFHPDWHVAKALSHGVGVHHARMPRALSAMMVDLFNKRKLEVLICTSTLIEGVNTIAQSIIVTDDSINHRPIDLFTYNNIKGRPGRLKQHFVGHVFIFSEAPTGVLPEVDIPALTQTEKVSDAILLEMGERELTAASTKRLQRLLRGSPISAETVRANIGIDVDRQLAVARKLSEEAAVARDLLRWNRIPRYNQLVYVCGLMWNELEGRNLAKGAVRSSTQLAFLISKLAGRPTTRELIEGALKYNDNDGDKATTSILGFLRYWAEFHYPNLLMCIQRIANDVFRKRNVPPFDFSQHALLVERLFRDVSTTALEEYGLPMQVAEKLSARIASNNDLDASLDRLAEIEVEELAISAAERRFLKRTMRGLPGRRS